MDNIYGEEFIPRRSTTHSAGYDIYAVEDMTINPWFKTFDTGIHFTDNMNMYSTKDISISIGSWVALILPRSSMGFKHGLRFANTVCVIDKDYRDTIKVSLCAEHSFTITKGERYAQMIFVPYCTYLDEITPTDKRSGGIGSTGH